MAQSNALVGPCISRIRPAMTQPFGHALCELARLCRRMVLGGEESGEAAHQPGSPKICAVKRAIGFRARFEREQRFGGGAAAGRQVGIGEKFT